jgi:hypothetical protein
MNYGRQKKTTCQGLSACQLMAAGAWRMMAARARFFVA